MSLGAERSTSKSPYMADHTWVRAGRGGVARRHAPPSTPETAGATESRDRESPHRAEQPGGAFSRAHAPVGAPTTEPYWRNCCPEGRMRASPRRARWATWQLATITIAACASAAGTLGGVDGCQPAFSEATPALAGLRGANGNRAGLAIATTAQSGSLPTTARSIDPSVTLLESRDKHRGLGAGIAGGVRGFFGGLNRKGRDMPELRLAAGKVTDSADSESGKLRDGKKKGKTVDIDQIARLSRSDVAGEEDVSEYDDEAFTLKSEALQVSKPLQPGRTPLQASAEDKAETDGAAMLYDTKLASYVGNKGVSEKGTWAQAQVLGLDCGWSAIPHPAKADRGGEDVHLVCRAGGATMFGVFDGVGGWAELGVDPAEYARRLAQELEEQLLRDPSIATWQERPLLSMLEVAFERLEQDELPGSCTVCLAMLTATGQLHVLNIGDSGLHVVRDGVSVFQTNEQQHYFNCPFQLGMGSDDSPGDADYYVLEDLAEGDLIVAATDGVWDNVYEEEMLQLLYNPSTFNRPELMARTLSEASHSHGKDQTYTSPFAANAQRQGLRYVGGKLDDVTVIISRVCLPSDVAAPASPADTASSPVSSMDETGSEE